MDLPSVSNGTTSHTYTYGNTTWRDLLTAYDGHAISYDGSGNPTTYYNGKDWTMAWAEGRRLVSANGDGKSLTFTYDSEGLRLTKKVGSTTYNYSYAGGKLLRQTGGGNTLDFFYDASGNPYALKYNGTLYYYITNLQGDVLHVVNTSGTPVVSYTYDPYGKPQTPTGTLASTLGTHNPLRYRGYVYDSETGLYYLQSRYYDPAIGRFINADEYVSTGLGILGCNMYAYCNNKPVNQVDNCGTTAETFQTWIQTMWWLCLVDLHFPVGDIIFAIGSVALLVETYSISYDQASKLRETSVEAASAFLDFASTAATPPPPNKGGKGTQVTSKTLYKKHGKNGFRIDVENPGNRNGQIHLQKGASKYFYNIADQTFRIGSSSGPLAPQSIQDLLALEEVIIAIAKGLKILGY